jgi:hypothetical protein
MPADCGFERGLLMPSVISFRCQCGARLSIVSETTGDSSGEISIMSCPNPDCRTKRLVSGRILQIFVVDDDQSCPVSAEYATGRKSRYV